ncbi:MAG: ABC transporter ATP-binding protein [Chloroflexi bacterium]|nr:ABC transporter ATP-binding protein [Chloroflexota bacterium]
MPPPPGGGAQENLGIASGNGALLRVEDLKVHFQVRKGLLSTDTVRAVDGVSLSVARGETVALVGESGSGKTTLGRATLRLVVPTGGRVLFDGVDITRVPEGRLKRFRQRAQAVFQDPYSSLSPFMTVFQCVEEPLRVHGVRSRAEVQERVGRALEQVRLTPAVELATKYPHTLSGGQRQRVGLARALVLEPEYIVADEPVSMIDASSRAEVLELLRELQEKRGISFLFITHDIASARHFSDRIAVMYLGRIVELGPPAPIVSGPLHPYTRALIAAVPEPDPANRFRMRQVVPGEPPSATRVPPGCAFHPRCPQYMKGVCEAAVPQLREVEPGHWAACYLYGRP